MRNRFAGKGTNTRPGSNVKTGRDYTYDKEYQKSPEQVANRTARNKARAIMMKEGKVRIGDNKDVDHKKPLKNGGSKTAKSNLRVVPRSVNRARKI